MARAPAAVAYLTSLYPAPSHTFIRREIAALERRGVAVSPFSIRPGVGDGAEQVPSVLGQGKLQLLAQAARAAFAAPGRTLATARLSQSHRERGLKGWVWSLFHLAEALALSAMLRRAGVGHLHSHFANSGATVGMLAAHQLGLPWSLTLHGISETDHPAGALLPDKLARAEFVACASWFMQAQAMRVTEPALWSKFHIVRCGVDMPSDPANLEAADEIALPIRRFVTVGRLSAEKGYPGLLASMVALRKKGITFSLRIVGDGPLRPEIERLVRAHGLGDAVTLLGALPETKTLAEIAAADAFVLPSLMEGLPVVLMEAMAFAKPVIAACVAGIPELVHDGETGLLFRPGDWAHMTEAMERLVTEPALAARLGRAGRARVAGEFDINHAVEPLIRLFAGDRLQDQVPASPQGGEEPRPFNMGEHRSEPAR